MGEPWGARALAHCGLPWIALDAQHGRWDDASVVVALELIHDDVPVVVRVRSLDAGLIGRALDAGAAGVIVPMVSTVDEAVAAARASAYPPRGERSWGPLRGGYASATPTRQPVCAVMIETQRALERAREIAATEGIDALFVGPFDLALALGTSVETLLADGTALRRIAEAATAAGRIAGAFAGTPERADRLRELGYGFIASATESELLARGAAAALA